MPQSHRKLQSQRPAIHSPGLRSIQIVGFGYRRGKGKGERKMKMLGRRRKKKNQTDQTLGRRNHRPLPYPSVVFQLALCGLGVVRGTEGVQDGRRRFF